MPAPILRHYRWLNAAAAGTWEQVGGFTVPANRALVISKIIVVNVHTTAIATNAAISQGAAPATGAEYIFRSISIAVGEVYTETGLVMVAGEQLYSFQNVGGGVVAYNVFGQEVDN